MCIKNIILTSRINILLGSTENKISCMPSDGWWSASKLLGIMYGLIAGISSSTARYSNK